MKNNVIFLGCTNDYGNSFSACNTKVEFMAKGLNEQGDICCIHNGLAGKPGLKQNEYKDFAGIGTVINYVCKGAWMEIRLFTLDFWSMFVNQECSS